MQISVGDKLPGATLARLGAAGLETFATGTLTKGRRVILFGLPGAFTKTCSAAHLPSFIRTAEALRARGIDHIICVSVNDAAVMQAWDKTQGASKAGIMMLADLDGAFTKAMGMNFDLPAAGFFGRSLRYSAYIEDGVVKILNMEKEPGVCNFTAGETLLEQI